MHKKYAILFITSLCSIVSTGQTTSKLQKKSTKWDTTGKNKLVSEDGNLRIYWWDTKSGGTMVHYSAFAKYNDGKAFKMKMLTGEGGKDYGRLYESIFTVKREDGKTVYLVITTATTGVDDIPESIQAYTIDNGELADTLKIFKTPQKLYNKIYIDFNWRSAYEKETIHLSKDKQKVYIPVIDNNLDFTNKYLVYKWDGNYFVYDKNAK